MSFKEESRKAKKCAFRYLSYRDRSRGELIHHLQKKGFSDNALNETLTFLEEKDFINEPRFALQFGRSRITNKKIGKERLKNELKEKGLGTQIINETLNSLYEEFDEREIAVTCAKKKLQSFSLTDIKKKRGRLAKFLERKGFTSNLIYQIVTQLVPNVSNNDLVASQLNKQCQKTKSSGS